MTNGTPTPIIKLDDLVPFPIHRLYIEPGRRNRPGALLATDNGLADGVTIHETDNPTRGANAEAHAYYFATNQESVDRLVSVHYTVDDREAWQSLPNVEQAFHAGDGAGPGNRTQIAIEICVNADGSFELARANAAHLAAALFIHGASDFALNQHFDWSGKHCPRRIRDRGLWLDFVANVHSVVNGAHVDPDQASGYATADQVATLATRLNRLNDAVLARFDAQADAAVKFAGWLSLAADPDAIPGESLFDAGDDV